MKIAVIGAGIFGITIAIRLSQAGHDVTLFEKENDVMTKVSVTNHFRHHHGYHYPRSKSTALESINARKSFEKEYGDCLLPYFPTYYSIVKKEFGTKVTPGQYLRFCEEVGLPYKIVPVPSLINKDKVEMTLEVPERAFDPCKLKKICKEKLKKSKVRVVLNCENVSLKEFDRIINCTYANINRTQKMLNSKQTKRQYELLELLVLKIPGKKFGAMNMDGEYTSIIPVGRTGMYTIAHAKGSILKRIVSDNFDGDAKSFGKFKSNRRNIMKVAINDFPILKKAKYIKSIFVVKVVKADVDKTDERPSEISYHGNGIYSVFAGKVITCVNVANKLVDIIKRKK